MPFLVHIVVDYNSTDSHMLYYVVASGYGIQIAVFEYSVIVIVANYTISLVVMVVVVDYDISVIFRSIGCINAYKNVKKYFIFYSISSQEHIYVSACIFLVYIHGRMYSLCFIFYLYLFYFYLFVVNTNVVHLKELINNCNVSQALFLMC